MYFKFAGANFLSRLQYDGNKKRVGYWFSANCLPAFVVAIAVICDRIKSPLTPNYGLVKAANICWIRYPIAGLVFFGIPLTGHLIFNISLYIITIHHVRNDLKETNSFRKKCVKRNASNESTSSVGSTASTSTISSPNQMAIFLRIGVLMGFTWITGFLVAATPQNCSICLKILSYFFVICNTSQGILMFVAFLCNAKILAMWRAKLKSLKRC